MSSRLVICLVLVVFASGCTTPIKSDKLREAVVFKTKEAKLKEQYGEPIRMAAVWTADVLSTPGAPTTRGFGGRIFFYNNKNQAVPVQGELIVYAYDDTDVHSPKRRADVKVGFSAEKFNSLFSDSEFGASYSVWVPWDNNLNHKRLVSLIPVFVTEDGRMIKGSTGKGVLSGRSDSDIIGRPGESRQQQGTITELSSGVRPVQHTETPPSKGLKTTTIPLSGSMKRRMMERRTRQTTVQQPTVQQPTLQQPTLQQPTAQSQQMASNLARTMLERQQAISALPPQQQALLGALRGGNQTTQQLMQSQPGQSQQLQSHQLQSHQLQSQQLQSQQLQSQQLQSQQLQSQQLQSQQLQSQQLQGMAGTPASSFGLRNHFGNQPIQTPYQADQFNTLPSGTSFRPPTPRRSPTPHAPRFERHQHQAQASQDLLRNPALVR